MTNWAILELGKRTYRRSTQCFLKPNWSLESSNAVEDEVLKTTLGLGFLDTWSEVD